MSQHSDLQSIIEQIYWVNDRYSKSTGFDEASFLLTYTGINLKKIISIKDFIAYRILDDEYDSIFAIGSANPCTEVEIEDYMLTYLETFFKNETVVDEISRVIIDDMSGIEIFANVTINNSEFLLYSCYLTDNKDAYLITAIIGSKFMAMNNELYTLARSFKRKDRKNDSKILEILKSIDKKLPIDDKKTLHQMLAIKLKFGDVDSVSIRRATADEFTDYDYIEKYPKVDILNEINALLKLSKDIIDTDIVVVSMGLSDTPSVTYYRKENDEEEQEDNEHNHEHDTATIKYHNDTKLTEQLIKFAEYISSVLDVDTKYGMVILVRERDYINFSAYFSDGGSYIPIEIGLDNDLNNSLEMLLMDIFSTIDPSANNYTILEMLFDNEHIRSKNIINKEVNISITDDDIYFDLEDYDAEEIDLCKVATTFYHELNDSDEPISSITINLDIHDKKIEQTELVMAKTFDGYRSLLDIDDEIETIKSLLADRISDESKLNTLILKIYPTAKLSIKYIYD